MSEVKELVEKFVSGQAGCFNENGNKNGSSISTRRDLLAGEVSREYALSQLPADVAEKHVSGDIHFHDLDYTVEGYYNCMLLDLENIFNKGLVLGDAKIEQPKRLSVATQLIPQLVTHVASNTYGGTSIHEIDRILVPYVKKSFEKHFKNHLRHSKSNKTLSEWLDFIDSHTDVEIEEARGTDIVLDLTIEDLYAEAQQAFQGLEYSMNALFSSGGQTPFSTFTFGLENSFYARIIQKNILKTRIAGLGDESKTAVFPKLVYALRKGVNMSEGEPNYEIKKLALECASKRIYPDILSYDKLMENYGFYVGPMGCVRGDETVNAYVGRIGFVNYPIEDFWEYCSKHYTVKKQPDGVNEYIDLPDTAFVDDSHTGTKQKVRALRLIRNQRGRWVKVSFANKIGFRLEKNTFYCTDNHPLPVEGKGRVYARDLEPGDKICVAGTGRIKWHTPTTDFAVVSKITMVSVDGPSYDFTTETDFFDVSGIVSHNCRSFLSAFQDEDGNYITQGRRNVGVCTINFPRIAMETETTEDFMRLLCEKMPVVKKALQWRIDKIKTVKAMNAPILYTYGATGHRLEPNEDVYKIFTNGEATASIGYIGLHEVALKFYGRDWRENPEAKEFTIEILRKLNWFKEQWNNEGKNTDGFTGFSVYGTPSESLTDRFCKLDREKFGLVEGITDKGFYVNSFHVLPEAPIGVFEKIDFEKDYPILSQGGNICYVETPSLKNNLSALEAIWDYFYDRVPYAGVNQPISKCFSCGNVSEFDADAKGYYCDSCGERENVQVVKRLCGYLSELSSKKVKEGRQLEINSRVKHRA